MEQGRSRASASSRTAPASSNNNYQEADRSFRIVEELQNHGVNVADIKKLQEAGLVTVGSILQTSTRDLLAIKGR